MERTFENPSQFTLRVGNRVFIVRWWRQNRSPCGEKWCMAGILNCTPPERRYVPPRWIYDYRPDLRPRLLLPWVGMRKRGWRRTRFTPPGIVCIRRAAMGTKSTVNMVNCVRLCDELRSKSWTIYLETIRLSAGIKVSPRGNRRIWTGSECTLITCHPLWWEGKLGRDDIIMQIIDNLYSDRYQRVYSLLFRLSSRWGIKNKRCGGWVRSET